MKLYVSKDGYLDAGEVALWILPGEIDHADNEAKHLIHETDTDKVNCRCSDFVTDVVFDTAHTSVSTIHYERFYIHFKCPSSRY